MAKPILIFDVNETLLQVQALEPHFVKAFHSPHLLKEWFDAVILYAQTANLTSSYEDFGAIGGHALEMVASAHNLALEPAVKQSILSGMRSLPPHPEVPAALHRLRDAGFRIAALTNSSQAAADAQLQNAGIHSLFEKVLSIDTIRRYKPAPETYAFAAQTLNATPGDLLLIAAHPWDVHGARHAGLRAAFIRRPGKAWFGTDLLPEITAADLTEVVEKLLTLA